MNAPFMPERPPEPLKIVSVERAESVVAPDSNITSQAITLTFNRGLSDDEVKAYEQLPPTPQMFVDVRAYAEQLMLARLVADLFRFYILGGLVLPDTPRTMDWLKSYMDGNGHGPVGRPMRWPGLIPSANNILLRWGYEPTEDGFVGRRPKEPEGDERPVG